VERLGVDFGLAHVGPGLFKVPHLERIFFAVSNWGFRKPVRFTIVKELQKTTDVGTLKEFLFMEMMLHHTFRVVSADTEMSWTTLLLLS
jgi:hypothetical protein